jgi:hypothetical protein
MAARLQSVPMTIGDWTATSTVLPANELSMTGAVGYFLRYYRNAKSGVTITALMLCGLLGMISTHTPDVCYAGAGYAITTRSLHQQTYGKPERRAHFRTATASRGGTSPSILRIFWGWNSSNGWSAPETPRWAFAPVPALCKLYVVRETQGQDAEPKVEPCGEFLRDFLPELDRTVFSAKD